MHQYVSPTPHLQHFPVVRTQDLEGSQCCSNGTAVPSPASFSLNPLASAWTLVRSTFDQPEPTTVVRSYNLYVYVYVYVISNMYI